MKSCPRAECARSATRLDGLFHNRLSYAIYRSTAFSRQTIALMFCLCDSPKNGALRGNLRCRLGGDSVEKVLRGAFAYFQGPPAYGRDFEDGPRPISDFNLETLVKTTFDRLASKINKCTWRPINAASFIWPAPDLLTGQTCGS